MNFGAEELTKAWADELYPGGGTGGGDPAYKGQWQPGTFHTGDVVAFGNALYRATQTTTTAFPSEVGTTTQNHGTAAYSVPLPTGTAVDDLVVVGVYVWRNTSVDAGVSPNTATDPDGFTNIKMMPIITYELGDHGSLSLSYYVADADLIAAGSVSIPDQGFGNPSAALVTSYRDAVIDTNAYQYTENACLLHLFYGSALIGTGTVSAGTSTPANQAYDLQAYVLDTKFFALATHSINTFDPTTSLSIPAFSQADDGASPGSVNYGEITVPILSSQNPLTYGIGWELFATQLPTGNSYYNGVGNDDIGVGHNSTVTPRGNASVAIGSYVYADAYQSVAIGISSATDAGTSGNGRYGVALGARAFSGDEGSVCIGYDGNAIGYGAVSIGYQSIVQAVDAIGIGDGAFVKGVGAIGIGLAPYITNDGVGAVAIGRNSYIANNSPHSVALGDNAGMQNDTDHAVAIGDSATVRYTSPGSIAIGSATLITETNSGIAIGNTAVLGGAVTDDGGTTYYAATPDSAIAIGTSALVQSHDAIAIGAGISIDHTSGFAIAIGTGASTNYYAIALGQTAAATGVFSIAMGGQAAADNTRGVAIGASSSATGINAVAIGPYTQATANGAVAIGFDSFGTVVTASGTDDFVLGTTNHKVSIPGLFGVHGALPVAQSAHPSTLADVIAILAAHGFCA